jgi:two-component system phosphate regulon sensor histidine kinase PhoR
MLEEQEMRSAELKAEKAFNRFTFVVPTSLLILLTYIQLFVTESIYKPGAWVVPLVSVAAGLLAIAEYFRPPKAQGTPSQYASSFAYHLILASFIIFAAPLHSGYVFTWILVVFSFYVKLNSRYLWMSYLGLLITQLSTLLFRDIFTIDEIIITATQFVIIVTISQLVISSRRYANDELDITRRSLRQQQFERQRLLSLINNMGEAVVATDEKGNILLYNAATLDLLDTNQSLDNKSIDKILSLKDKSNKSIKLTKLMGSSPTGLTESSLIHEFSPGDYINMYINIAPIKLGFKEDVGSGYIVILRDITKEKSLEEERDEFISVVSHELRTPAAIAEGGVSNSIFAIENKLGKEEILSSLNEAHNQILFLSSMINDLATLSRAERTDTRLEIGKVKPDELLEEIAKDYQDEAVGKNLTLSVSSAKDTKSIKSSELYLREILQNFITNSLKYTKKGSIIIHVRSNSNGDAVFSVADSGIGLSKSDKRRIFEKFFRSEDYRTRESNGTGLGLYVSSKLANRLKAKIEVESELNKGSTFTITVPSYKK